MSQLDKNSQATATLSWSWAATRHKRERRKEEKKRKTICKCSQVLSIALLISDKKEPENVINYEFQASHRTLLLLHRLFIIIIIIIIIIHSFHVQCLREWNISFMVWGCVLTACLVLRISRQGDDFKVTCVNNITSFFLCFVDRAYRYNRVKKHQLDAQLVLSIFRQPLHVSVVSRPSFRTYNRMYTTIGTYYSF